MSMSPAISRIAVLPQPAEAQKLRQLALMAWGCFIATLLLAVAGLVLVLHQQAPQAVRDGTRFADLGWITIGFAAAACGGLASLLASRAALAGQRLVCLVCICLTLMAGCTAFAVRVIEAVAVLRYPLGLNEPTLIKVGAPDHPAHAPTTPPGSTDPGAAADAVKGRTLYENSCAPCHGGAGEGVNGVAPALAATAWLNEQSDEALVSFLTVGRAPSDPASKTGKAMPARGGNAALSDRDLADIVAHLRTLEAASASSAGGSSGLVAATPPRWLTQPPPQAAPGLIADELQPNWPDVEGSTRPAFNSADRDLFVHCLGAMGLIQTLHLGVLILVMMALLASGFSERLAERMHLLQQVTFSWFVLAGAAAVAAVVLVFVS